MPSPFHQCLPDIAQDAASATAASQGPTSLIEVVRRLSSGSENLSDPTSGTANTTSERASKLAQLQRKYLVKLHALLVSGADPNLRDADNRTALLIASTEVFADFTKELLAYKADPNLPEKNGLSPLICAAGYGPLEIVKQLLSAAANVNAKTSAGITALMAAAVEGSPDIGLLLLNSGADKR